MNRLPVTSATLFAPILFGIVACGSPPRPPEPEKPPLAVRAAKVTSDVASTAAAAPGTVAARVKAVIVARSASTVSAVRVREGEAVAAGQIVAVLDDRDAAARLRAAEAARDAAVAEHDRIDALARRGSATRQEQERTSASAEASRAAVEEARSAISYFRLSAPFRGRIGSVAAHRGDLVVPGQKLLEIESDQGFEVQAPLEARAAASLAAGQTVSVRVDGIPEAVPAVVRSVSPAGDPETHRFLLRADLPRDARLRTGLFARVETPGGEPERRLTVPAEAVFERGGLTGVFVVSGERARLRWIAPGEASAGRMEVRAGLAAGELVALEPGGLEDGRRVSVQP
jgi:RND family efflux transporter MFP subunit